MVFPLSAAASSSSSRDTIVAPFRKAASTLPKLQVVTQTLHIPPTSGGQAFGAPSSFSSSSALNTAVSSVVASTTEGQGSPAPAEVIGDGVDLADDNCLTFAIVDSHSGSKVTAEPLEGQQGAAEVERLRRDMRKLREYLKTSVQERKLLVKKICMLNDRVAEAHARKSASPEKSTMTDPQALAPEKAIVNIGVQCQQIGHGPDRAPEVAVQKGHSFLNSGHEDLAGHVGGGPGGAAVLDVSPPARLRRPGERCTNVDVDLLELSFETPQTLASILSSSSLPSVDPGQWQRPLLSHIQVPGPGASAKDPEDAKSLTTGSGAGGAASTPALAPIRHHTDEDEDSWSEPDVSTSRKRMGISQRVLNLIERGSSSSAATPGAANAQLNRRSSAQDSSGSEQLKHTMSK